MKWYEQIPLYFALLAAACSTGPVGKMEGIVIEKDYVSSEYSTSVKAGVCTMDADTISRIFFKPQDDKKIKENRPIVADTWSEYLFGHRTLRGRVVQ